MTSIEQKTDVKLDSLAQEDHTYIATRDERTRYERLWCFTQHNSFGNTTATANVKAMLEQFQYFVKRTTQPSPVVKFCSAQKPTVTTRSAAIKIAIAAAATQTTSVCTLTEPGEAWSECANKCVLAQLVVIILCQLVGKVTHV